MKKMVSRGLAKISKSQQAEFEGLLGRLQTKYEVGLSMPSFDFSYLPFSITLGDRKFEVPLDDWGSGTKNRTLVLLTLFRARQIGDSEPSAAKITPVIIMHYLWGYVRARLDYFVIEWGSWLADNAFTWMLSRCTSYNVAITANRVSLAMRTVLRICIGPERVYLSLVRPTKHGKPPTSLTPVSSRRRNGQRAATGGQPKPGSRERAFL
jgi:hypothetical protein